MKPNSKRENTTVALIMSIAAIIFFCFNYFVPYYDDDIWYALRYIPGESLAPITNCTDILESQYHHYMGENSRALIHIALQSILAILPDVGFDIVNTAVFLLLVWCMAIYTQGHRDTPRPITLLISLIGIYALLPDMDYLYYWAAGSLNYMWTSVTTLSFMLMWQHTTSQHRPITIASIGMALWSFCCGFGHEALSLPVGAAILIYMLTHYRSIGSNQTTLIAIAYGLGCVAILASPGLENKAQHIAYDSAAQYLSAIVITMRQLRAIPLCILVFVLLCLRKSWRTTLWEWIRSNSFLLTTAIVAFLFVISIRAGAYTMRIFYAAEFFALLILLRLAGKWLHHTTSRTINAASIIASVLVVVWCIAILPHAYATGKQHKALLQQYSNDSDGVMFIDQETTPRWAHTWVMNLHSTYYEAPEAEWRGFVIPLIDLQDSLAVPYPMTARNSDNSYQLYNKYIEILPYGIKEVIEQPATFFTPLHKVAGDNPFYITADSCYVVADIDSTTTDIEWQWLYYPATWSDPSASLPGRIRRLVAPHTLPPAQPMLYPDTILLPDHRQYVIYKRPPYRRLEGIEKI